MEDAAMQQPAAVAGDAEQPEVDPARAALVKEWCARVKSGKEHPATARAFRQMKKNQELAAHGAEKAWVDADKYVVPIINRHINQAVAQLYAKNPTAVAKRRKKLLYQNWDGRPDSLQMAMEGMAMGDPNAAAVVQEVAAGEQYKLMTDRLGRTVEILWDYYTGEQSQNFKQQLKAAVRRTKVCKVAYIKIGFQRALEPRPEISARIEDVTSKIAAVERILKEVAAGDIDEQSARMAELKSMLADLRNQEMMVVREGVVFDFPRAHEIIVDPACRHLKTFSGARWIAHEFEMTADEIEETYKVKVSGAATAYRSDGAVYEPLAPGKDERVVYRVYEVQDKRNRQTLTICEGHADFLREPAAPDCDIDRFWTIFALVFNEIEHDEELYPPSDVELAKHIQSEYNRSREALRQHRIAARPYYVHDGSLDEEELRKVQNHADHEIVKVPSLGDGQTIESKLQRGPTAPIDPNLYEVEMHFNDLLRVVGAQEANLGGTSDSTATESSIAEQSRSASLADNVDDLDELLSDLAKAFGHIALIELSKETVVEIVGPGAVWPEMRMTREEVAKDLLLEIKAGSSGRPNRAADLANLERAMPIVMQLPGVQPRPYAERYSNLLDIDPEEGYAAGLPSMTAMNAMVGKAATQPGTGDPATDPAQQGGQGAQNAPGPGGNERPPGAQPAYPAPAPPIA